jgi:hypothetical protein
MSHFSYGDEDNPYITELLDAYGVDASGSTCLGCGGYKEVHRTNIPGVVMVITSCKPQLDIEMEILNFLADEGFPAMKYYCMERISNTTFVLAERLFPPDSSWDERRLKGIEQKVSEFLTRMIDNGIFLTDLQFMLDENDCPVFTDPIGLESENMVRSWNCKGKIYLDAICKDRGSDMVVRVERD